PAVLTRLPSTIVISVLARTWVKICSLLMSIHTSPLRYQIRPSSGKSSSSAQRRNDSRSTTQVGTLTCLDSLITVIMALSFRSEAEPPHDNEKADAYQMVYPLSR